MAEQPHGTVTLLFTDIEGSTGLLLQLGKERYAKVLEQHQDLLRREFDLCEGYEVDSEGDSFFIAFASADAAIKAAACAQQALGAAPWPTDGAVRVRMGIHTGEPLVAAPKYVGVDVHRAARIMAAAHGGQILLSRATAQIVSEDDPSAAAHLRDLGSHRLKDLPDPQPLYQLLVDGLQDAFPPLRTIGAGNLPLPLNPLVGRGGEVEELVSLARAGTRLLTVTGEGGCGKTRLALEVAHAVADDYENGAFFVPLAQISDPARVASAIADAVGVRGTTGREAGAVLSDALRGTRTLLVLDNYEHVLEAAPIAADIVAAAPRVTVLATSRERLHLDGELVRQLNPLPHRDAVTLFIARSGDDATDDSATSAIVDRLDGLPLALELAAARVKLLGPDALLHRLEHRFDVLGTVRRDAPDRQQTLLATIEWSYDLLTDEERRVLVALSMFPSGCTLDAAERVCAATLDTLASLFDKSLLRRRHEPGGDVRFWMLETIREFAQLRGDSDSDVAALQVRRLAFYRDLVELVERDLWGRNQLHTLALLDREHENMLVTLADGFSSPETTVDAARLAAALVDYWDIRAEFAEAQKWYELALSHESALPKLLRARIVKSLAVAWARRGDPQRAHELGSQAWVAIAGTGADREEARALEIVIAMIDRDDPVQVARATEARDRASELAGRSSDPLAVAHALAAMAQYAEIFGDLDAAAELTEQLVGVYRAAGDDRNLGIMLHHQAIIAARRGRYADAAALATAALAIAEELGDHGMELWSLQLLAEAQLGVTDIGAARDALERSIEVAERYGMLDALGTASEREGTWFFAVAALAAVSGGEEDAAVLAGAADRYHANPDPTFPEEAWSQLQVCRGRHGQKYEVGGQLPFDAALDHARQALRNLAICRAPQSNAAPRRGD